MAAYLVVPAVFGFVGDAPLHVVHFADTHAVHHLLLEDVGEYLGVEAARLVALGDGQVEVARLVEGVHDREFGQQLGEGLFQCAAIVDFELEFIYGVVLDAGFGVPRIGVVAVAQPGVLEVEAQSCGEAPAPQRIVGFVVEGAASRRHAEIASQKKLVAARSVFQPPAVAVALVVFVGVFEDQLLDARLFEVHRGVHRAVTVESECPQQPAVGFIPA